MKNAHSHNDYKHKKPLSDALHYKFISVEADLFLAKGQLVVAHLLPVFKRHKTLEKLYLKPLLDSCTKNNGRVYSNCDASLLLLIDIKSDAEKTYKELKKILQEYETILTRYENGNIIKGGVTIILSGNKPHSLLKKDSIRYAFIDQSLLNMNDSLKESHYQLASTKYSNILTWRGKGEIPKDEKEKLISLVQLAHDQGKKTRLWASPENMEVWNELLNCGVDLINTDKLKELHTFLEKQK